MRRYDLQAAITGANAPSVLKEVLQELIDHHHCPKAVGFEGPETFPDCEECIYCLAKKILKPEAY